MLPCHMTLILQLAFSHNIGDKKNILMEFCGKKILFDSKERDYLAVKTTTKIYYS